MRDQWENVKSWADEELLSNAYRAISVSTFRVRRRLRDSNRPFIDPNVPHSANSAEVDRTADWIIEQVSAQTGLRGGLAAMAGALSIPPELLATIAAIVRLSQRLTIVYGFDPHEDQGQMVMWRALAAGLETELPTSGPVGLRLRDVVRGVSVPSNEVVGAAVTRALVRKSAWMVLRKITRFVPVLSTGSSLVGGRRKMQAAGLRMKAVLQRLAEAGPLDGRRVVEAVEVRS